MGPASAKGEREGGERRRELRRKQEKRKERLENPRECCELLPGKGGIDDQQRPSREGLSEKHDQRSLAPNSWVSDGEVTQGVRELTANCEDLWQSISLSLVKCLSCCNTERVQDSQAGGNEPFIYSFILKTSGVLDRNQASAAAPLWKVFPRAGVHLSFLGPRQLCPSE